MIDNLIRFEQTLADETATKQLGQQLAGALASEVRAHIYLEGQLGAGKTCLVRGFISGLGYEGKVKSPSYSLIEPYLIQGRQVYHFDFYRINDPQELELIGINEYFAENAICLVEWPELAAKLLPVPDLEIKLNLCDAGRQVSIEANNSRGKLWVQRLSQAWC